MKASTKIELLDRMSTKLVRFRHKTVIITQNRMGMAAVAAVCSLPALFLRQRFLGEWAFCPIDVYVLSTEFWWISGRSLHKRMTLRVFLFVIGPSFIG